MCLDDDIFCHKEMFETKGDYQRVGADDKLLVSQVALGMVFVTGCLVIY